MIKVELLENESFERMLIRFKRKVINSQIFKDLENKRYFQSNSEKKRSKRKLSKKRKQRILEDNE